MTIAGPYTYKGEYRSTSTPYVIEASHIIEREGKFYTRVESEEVALHIVGALNERWQNRGGLKIMMRRPDEVRTSLVQALADTQVERSRAMADREAMRKLLEEAYQLLERVLSRTGGWQVDHGEVHVAVLPKKLYRKLRTLQRVIEEKR